MVSPLTGFHEYSEDNEPGLTCGLGRSQGSKAMGLSWGLLKQNGQILFGNSWKDFAWFCGLSVNFRMTVLEQCQEPGEGIVEGCFLAGVEAAAVWPRSSSVRSQ